jgi:hypothetical protein
VRLSVRPSHVCYDDSNRKGRCLDLHLMLSLSQIRGLSERQISPLVPTCGERFWQALLYGEGRGPIWEGFHIHSIISETGDSKDVSF